MGKKWRQAKSGISENRARAKTKKMDDFRVAARSTAKIEEMSLAWREALRIKNAWAPDMVRLVENELPKILQAPFALVVRDDGEMDGAEAV